MPKFSKVASDVAKLRELADHIEKNGVAMPDYYISHTLHIGLTATNYGQDENGEWGSTIDEDETKQNIKKFLATHKNVDKNYSDDRLVITTTYSDGTKMVIGTVDRSIACKKKVVGKKFIKEHLVPSRFEEEVEWVCDENISLKKLVAGV